MVKRGLVRQSFSGSMAVLALNSLIQKDIPKRRKGRFSKAMTLSFRRVKQCMDKGHITESIQKRQARLFRFSSSFYWFTIKREEKDLVHHQYIFTYIRKKGPSSSNSKVFH